MKKIFLLLVCLGCVSGLYAQQPQYVPDSLTLLPPAKTGGLHFAMEAGAGMSFGSLKGMYTYMAPRLSWGLTKKFSLDAGVMYMHSNTPLFSEGTGCFGPIAPQYHAWAGFVRGNYQLTDRIALSGTVYHEMGIPAYLQPYRSNDMFRSNSYGLGMQYKINEHSSFGIEFRSGAGNSLFSGNPGLQPSAAPFSY